MSNHKEHIRTHWVVALAAPMGPDGLKVSEDIKSLAHTRCNCRVGEDHNETEPGEHRRD